MSLDRMVYTFNSGIKQVMDRMSTSSNNLANVATTGFRAQIDSLRSAPVVGDGLPTRTLSIAASTGSSFQQGAILETGNNLDVAIEGKGWIVVKGADGQEAYTRAGSLGLDIAGMLQTQQGQKVMGDSGGISGPITVPPNTTLLIGKDGTVSVSQTGSSSNVIQILGRIKLVNPPEKSLLRGDDGLFRLPPGQTATPTADVTLLGGSIESSNVNSIEEMVNMINLSRQFEINVKMLQNADTIAGKADQLLTFN